ncbi:MAG: tetratricopeptide repeat protein [Rhodothermaceae bacterium]
MNKLNYFALLVFSLFLFSCASKEIVKKTSTRDIKKEVSKTSIDKASEHFINGNIAEMRGDYKQAINEYKQALKFDPGAGIHYALAKSHFITGERILALKHSKKSVDFEPDNIEYNNLLGTIYKKVNLPDSAVTVYNHIIKLDSANVKALYNLGMLYGTDKPLEALETYNKILDLTGPEWSVLVKIADLNERMGRIDETISTMQELLKLNPENLYLQKILIETYIKKKDFAKAEAMLDEALQTYPDDVHLIEFKGNIFIQNNKWIEGAEEYLKILHKKEVVFPVKVGICASYLNKSISDSTVLPVAKKMLEVVDQDTTSWEIKFYLGGVSLAEKKDSIAIDYYKDSFKLAEWNVQILTRLAGLLFDNQRYDESIEILSKAINNFPDDFVLNLILGLSYTSNEDNENAVKYLEKAVKLNSTDITALMAYGFNLDRVDKDDEAIKYLSKALEIDPENVQVLSNLGLIYENREVYEKSDSLYQKALAIDSTNVLVLNNYAYSLSERGIRLKEAEQMSRQALDAEPESASYLDTYGWIMFKMGNLEKALEYVLKAYEKDEEDPALLEHLGDIYLKMDDKTKALEYWEKALKFDEDNEEIKNKILKEKE